MNANLNTYLGKAKLTNDYDSDSIRRAYLSRSRKETLLGVIDSTVLWYVIFALKVICGVASAVGFFAILGMIENGAISPITGILFTVLAALLECLCFVPIGQRPTTGRRTRR